MLDSIIATESSIILKTLNFLRDTFLRKAFLHILKAFLSVAFFAFFICYFMNISEVIVSVIDCIRIAQERMKTCID